MSLNAVAVYNRTWKSQVIIITHSTVFRDLEIRPQIYLRKILQVSRWLTCKNTEDTTILVQKRKPLAYSSSISLFIYVFIYLFTCSLFSALWP
jgi:hypothetical protein